MVRLSGVCVLLIFASFAAAGTSREAIPVVNEGGIRNAWTLPPGTKLPVPGYPSEFSNDQAEVCVAVGYLINPDGHTSDFALLKSWSAGEPKQDRDRYWSAFAGVASAALSQWRFIPKADVAAPREVYTVATFVFASPNVRESSKQCAIPNLGQRLVELRQDPRVLRRMSVNGVFDRLELDPTLEAHYLSRQRNQQSPRKHPPATPPVQSSNQSPF